MSSFPITRLSSRLLAGTLLVTALTATPSVSQARSLGTAMQTVTVVAAHPALPRSVRPGLLAIRLVASAGTPWGIGLVRLKPGASFLQAQNTGGDLFKLRRFVTFIGGEIVPPSGAGTVIVNAGVPGSYAMHISGKEGDPGRVLPFAVTRPGASITAPAGSQRTVRLLARSIAGLSGRLPRGMTTFMVTNQARALRNMQIWRLDPGKTQRDFITAFTHDNLHTDPGWLHVAGGMDVLSSGQTAWMTLRLAPGTYVAESPLPDRPNGKALVLDGMITTFTVS